MIYTCKLFKAIQSYWTSLKNNVFNNARDALCGLFPLVILPFCSLIPTIKINCATFWDYTFPIISICIAGLCDAINRMETKEPRSIILWVRIILDLLSLVLSAVFLYSDKCTRIFPPLILAISGILLIREIFQRIETAIQLSEWYPN